MSEGLKYDGSFELAWLRDNQAVRYGGPGYCEIVDFDDVVLGRIYIGESITGRLAEITKAQRPYGSDQR